MDSPIAMIGVPTALGGHLSGMEETPAGMRALGFVDRLRERPGLAGVRDRRRGRPVHRARATSPIRTRAPRTGRRSARSCRASATSSRRRWAGAGRPGGRAPARARRRLHGARRRARGPAGGATGRPPRDRLVRCARRLQHARHDAVGERLGDAVRDAPRARRSRTSSRPPTDRRSWSRTRRCSAGRSSTRPSRGCWPRRASRISVPGCSGRRPGGPPSRAGHGRSHRGSTGSTSPSTWTASTAPRAGR